MRRAALVLAMLLLTAGTARAQSMDYGQCQDRARDRLEGGQNNPSVGRDRARSTYTADMQECVRMDARERARDVRADDQRRQDQRQDQQRLDQQRQDQRRRDELQRNRR